ncbi:nucleotidyltransferase family protein [Selenomonas sp. KH1T6]|uniref:nucleotidyltransferase family protein n=1 Tax=Selenomonas sp. KH1T6 TaxID=3158784 RepID=UPI0008A80303|nr:hypothetical protein SAMN05216583_103156 [Selenomonas ruminantium]
MLTVSEIKERVTPILKKYDVKNAYLFGSYARGDANENSDVDIRVDRGNSKKLVGFAVGSFYMDLKEALGCEVDLMTRLPNGGVSKPFIDSIRRDEVLIYGDSQ